MEKHADVGLSTVSDAIDNWSLVLFLAGFVTVFLSPATLLLDWTISEPREVPVLHFLVASWLFFPSLVFFIDRRSRHIKCSLACLAIGFVIVACRLTIVTLVESRPLLTPANGGVAFAVGAFAGMPTICCLLGWLSHGVYKFALGSYLAATTPGKTQSSNRDTEP